MEKDVDRTNAWFYQTNHARPWPGVQAGWETQFRRCLELAGAIPEQAMLEPARYP